MPRTDGEDAPYWQALRRREVRVQRCAVCGAFRFPAGHVCPRCRATDHVWEKVEAQGTVESWCVFHKAYLPGFEVPYTVLQVRLDCGVRLFSNPVDAGDGELRIGLRVAGVFEDVAPDVTLLKFRPAHAMKSADE
jgi:uncharacterized OB-fold protein